MPGSMTRTKPDLVVGCRSFASAQCGFCLFDHRSAANKKQPKPTRANREIHVSTIISRPRQHLLTQANKNQHFGGAATRFVRHRNSIFQPNSGYWNIKECVTGGAGNELQMPLANGLILWHISL